MVQVAAVRAENAAVAQDAAADGEDRVGDGNAEDHERNPRQPDVPDDREADEQRRSDVEDRPGVADPRRNRVREEDELGDQPGKNERSPAELDRSERGRPPAQADPQDDADDQCVEDEHRQLSSPPGGRVDALDGGRLPLARCGGSRASIRARAPANP